jgi:hypothetical protein
MGNHYTKRVFSSIKSSVNVVVPINQPQCPQANDIPCTPKSYTMRQFCYEHLEGAILHNLKRLAVDIILSDCLTHDELQRALDYTNELITLHPKNKTRRAIRNEILLKLHKLTLSYVKIQSTLDVILEQLKNKQPINDDIMEEPITYFLK